MTVSLLQKHVVESITIIEDELLLESKKTSPPQKTIFRIGRFSI